MAFWIHCGAGHEDKCHNGHLAHTPEGPPLEMSIFSASWPSLAGVVTIGGVTNTGTVPQVGPKGQQAGRQAPTGQSSAGPT